MEIHHQVLSDPNTSVTSQLNGSSAGRSEMSNVINLSNMGEEMRHLEEIQPVTTELSFVSVSEGLQSVNDDLRGAKSELHCVQEELQSVGNELQAVEAGMGSMQEEMPHVQEGEASHLDGTDHRIDENRTEVIHDETHLLGDGTDVLHGEKSVKLPIFNNSQGPSTHEIHLTSMAGGSTTLPLDTQQYYEALQAAHIMVYDPMQGANTFESLVVPLSKDVGDKSDVDLLQSAVNEAEYQHNTQDMSQPLYVVQQPPQHKVKQESGLVMHHLQPSSSIAPSVVLERSSNNSDYAKEVSRSPGIAMSIGADFNVISASNYGNSVTTVTNVAHLSMSTVYHSSTDTDSEVALTLASLGDPKHEKMDLDHGETNDLHDNKSIYKNNTTMTCREDEKIKVSSMEMCEQQYKDMGNCHHDEANNCEKDAKPTLVLRSRRSRGTVPNSHYQDQYQDFLEDPEKIGKRKRRKGTKANQNNQNRMNIRMQPDQTPLILQEPILPVNNHELNTGSLHAETQKENNLLGQLLKASEHCEPATLIPEGVVDDVIPAVGYRIMDMTNLSEMISMMHRCTGALGNIVIQEQASLREGAVSQLSVICTRCQEGSVCATSNRASPSGAWDINSRVEQLIKEFNIKEDQVQRMLEILGIFYRPSDPSLQPPPPLEVDNSRGFEDKKKKKKDGGSKSEGKVKNIVCDICKARFELENHLKKHLLSHNHLLHTCPYCHAYFKKPFNLRQHILKHENFKYKCHLCPKEFSDKSSVKQHVKIAHKKSSLNSRLDLQCKECSRQFQHMGHLKEHMRLHTGERPYMCELCGKKFMWHDSIKKHMQTHSAESKYKCRLCNKLFRWLQGVRQHLQQQHKLKKSDIAAQVVTAATETATTATVQHYQSQQHQHQDQQQQLQQHTRQTQLTLDSKQEDLLQHQGGQPGAPHMPPEYTTLEPVPQ